MAKRKNAISTSSRTLSSKRQKSARITTISSHAYMGALLTTVREGTPSSILTTLVELENEGHIEPDENIIAEELDNDELLLSLDSEISLDDEDISPNNVFDVEINETIASCFVLGKTEPDDKASIFSEESFEIVVSGASCSLMFPMWSPRIPRTYLGQQVLYEVDYRIRVLKSIAYWLSKNRKPFLLKHDCWYLGCNALDELKLRQIPVEQKSFLRMLDLTPKVSEESFSRYIRHCSIVWPDGICPLNLLFSDTAKEAWVANAVQQFMTEVKMKLSTGSLDYYSDVTIPRDSKRKHDLSGKSIDAMDLPTFIAVANMKAGTKWKRVIDNYGNMIVGKNNE